MTWISDQLWLTGSHWDVRIPSPSMFAHSSVNSKRPATFVKYQPIPKWYNITTGFFDQQFSTITPGIIEPFSCASLINHLCSDQGAWATWWSRSMSSLLPTNFLSQVHYRDRKRILFFLVCREPGACRCRWKHRQICVLWWQDDSVVGAWRNTEACLPQARVLHHQADLLATNCRLSPNFQLACWPANESAPNPYTSPMEIESMIHCWKQAFNKSSFCTWSIVDALLGSRISLNQNRWIHMQYDIVSNNSID